MPLYYSSLLPALCTLTQQAGALIMQYYGGDTDVMRKADDSPVTEADLAANRLIVDALTALTPDIPIVSEEGDKPDVTGQPRFWLVDPLDGTKSFIRREGEFTVNIGLVEHGAPTLGVIYIPAQGAGYWGAVGEGAWRQLPKGEAEPIHTRTPPAGGVTAIASRSHFSGETAAFMEDISVTEHISAASSLKFCRLAEGAADIYPRFGPTMEWDTAAGHAILASAGGCVNTPDGTPFTYAKPDFRNGSFVAWGAHPSL